jgi:hypothetical protein
MQFSSNKQPTNSGILWQHFYGGVMPKIFHSASPAMIQVTEAAFFLTKKRGYKQQTSLGSRSIWWFLNGWWVPKPPWVSRLSHGRMTWMIWGC